MIDVAPITLITGTPGMGKTALAVSLMMDMEGKRPIYVMGIPDLKIEHTQCPPIKDWTEARYDDDANPDLELHYFTFPPHSAVIIDEAQRVYRPRNSSSKVPPHVAAFETVRHTGVEFFLLTQSPKLLDSNIRELVGKHIAIGKRLLGRYLYEWPKVGDIDSKLSREEAARRRYKPPRKAFSLYKSAEVHLKSSTRIHQVFFVLAAALAFFGWSAWSAFQVVIKHTQPALPASPVHQVELQRPGAVAQTDAIPQAAALSELDFLPVYPDDPGSAPAYEGMRQIAAVPRIETCISTSTRCICYTQQQTRVPITEERCRKIAAGEHFDPYRIDAPPPVNSPLQNKPTPDTPPTQPSGEPERVAGSPKGLGV